MLSHDGAIFAHYDAAMEVPAHHGTRPLPLSRLLVVGVLVPAVCVAADHALLSRMMGHERETGLILLTLTVFVLQVGLFGVLCGRFIEQPLLRWIIYIWCWVLVDLQDVIVHIMLPRVREFYALERLWTVGDQPPSRFDAGDDFEGEAAAQRRM